MPGRDRFRSRILIFRDIYDADTYGRTANDIQPDQFGQGGSHVLFLRSVGRYHDRHGVVRPRSFVLEGPGNADLVIAQNLPVACHHAGLIFRHEANVESAHQIIDALDKLLHLAARFQLQMPERFS